MSSLAALGADLGDDLVAATEPTDTTSSLVLKEKNVARCPQVGFDLVALDDGDRVPGSCKTYGCEVCGPRKAFGWQQLLAASRPERFVTLTLAPLAFAECRNAVNRLHHELRRRGYRWQLSWAIEPNPRKTGNHIHGVQHGDYVPQALLQKLWGHIVHVEAITVEQQGEGRAAMYVVKGAGVANYMTKGTLEDLPRHLELNGGWRVEHHTRGYLRLDSGDPATARALHLALHGGPHEGRYVMAGQKESLGSIRARIQFGAWMREGYLRLHAPTQEVS